MIGESVLNDHCRPESVDGSNVPDPSGGVPDPPHVKVAPLPLRLPEIEQLNPSVPDTLVMVSVLPAGRPVNVVAE